MFVYPLNFKLYLGDDAVEAGRLAAWAPLCGAAVASSGVAACVTYQSAMYEDTNFRGASFQIRNVERAHSAVECSIPEKYPGGGSDFYPDLKHPTKAINAIEFVHGSRGGSNMGHRADTEMYRAFRKDTCGEVSFTINTDILEDEPDVTDDRAPEKPFTKADDQQVRNDLEKILSSFRFLR